MLDKLKYIQYSLPGKIIIAVIIITATALLIRILLPTPLTKQHWAVYYNQNNPNPPSLLSGWDLLVIDNDAHPDFSFITNERRATTKLAYISIGEIASYRSDFKEFEKSGILLGLKKGQTNVYVTDIRKDGFYSLIKRNIEKAKNQGFDGIMLDTLDTTIALGRSDEIGFALDGITKPYPGMQDAAIKLVKQIHADFPGTKIMINRAFDMIPSVADSINMVIAESTITDGTNKYYTGDNLATYEGIRKMLKETHVPVYALDYWDMNDKAGVEKLYDAQREQGFCPYVSDPSLQTLYRKP